MVNMVVKGWKSDPKKLGRRLAEACGIGTQISLAYADDLGDMRNEFLSFSGIKAIVGAVIGFYDVPMTKQRATEFVRENKCELVEITEV